MADLNTLMDALNMAHWELSEAFKGMPSDDLWTRPHPRLLSVGEISAHIAYWEAQSFFGEGFESPLTSAMASYYTTNVVGPFVLPLSAEEVFAEVTRVHEACKAAYASLAPNADDKNPHRGGWSWEQTIQYQCFHVAYHTGQIYSVRHLLGHETEDN